MSELNSVLQNILYSNGLAKNKDYTTKDELAAINDEQFKNAFQGNTTLADLQALQYFTGITTIPENCFKSNTALYYVRLPKNIISIGNNAFYGCSSLKKVLNFSNLNITKNSTEFGYIGKNVDVLLNNPIIEDDYIFIFENNAYVLYDYLGNESDLELPKNYKGNTYIIGRRAFYSNLNITSIIIPEGIMSIEHRAFFMCSNLTSINIPNSITNIKEYTFYKCSKLTSIKISSNITSIGSSAFEYCVGLTSVNIEDLTAWCKIKFSSSYANPLYYAHNLYLNGKLVTNLEIPDEISEINMYVFCGCTSLTSINIRNNITSIGNGAFFYCSKLTSVVIPDSVTSIGESVFYSCANLTSVLLPNTITKISYGTFYKCSALTSIVIPNSVTSIGGNAFAYCQSLTSIKIPNSVTSIGDHAFTRCLGLTSVEIPNSVINIYSYAFYECPGLTSIEIPNGVTNIGDRAFYDCYGLISVTIPNSVTKIGTKTFWGCSKLNSITCKAINPPSIYNNTFTSTDKILYVPEESIETYKSANYWKQFTNIQAINN